MSTSHDCKQDLSTQKKTNQEGSLKRRLLLEVVRSELQVPEPLPRVLRQLAHLAVRVGGQRPRPGRHGGLLVAVMLRHPIGRPPSVRPKLPGAAHRRRQRGRRRGVRRRSPLIAVPPPSPVSGEEEAGVLKVPHIREQLFSRVDSGWGSGGDCRRPQRGRTAALPVAKTDTSVDNVSRCQATLKGPELWISAV